MQNTPLDVAYFSMEFAFDDRFHNFAGGLGVLAADAMLSFADLKIPAVGVTLWYHQSDDADKMLSPSPYMRQREETVEVQIEDRTIKLVIWEYTATGASGDSVPVLFLSAHHPDNKLWDRDLTKWLYASDRYTRLGQEAILSIGGYRALKACGFGPIRYYHMNEGHTALLGLERLRANGFNYDTVRSKSTFTTHTPIPAGHDYFDYQLAHTVLGSVLPANIQDLATHDNLGMTQLAMNLSIRTNAVSRTHRDVTRGMFPGREIEYVTNGIYHPRWIGPNMGGLLSDRINGWQLQPERLREVFDIPDHDIAGAHREQKRELINWINTQPRCFCSADATPEDDKFDEDTLTIGFARRFVSYKRPGLIFRNLDRLRALGYRKVQFVFAGHCHPDDAFCNSLHDAIAHHDCELRGQIRTIVLSDYNLEIAQRMVRGVDVWLNNPVPPFEASGTSGMKAALNGALNLSILDGWWVEGFEMSPKAGWGVVGATGEGDEHDAHDNAALLDALDDIISCYHDRPDEWKDRVKHAIALGGTFNTHRMIREYQEKMWRNE
jgi:starch phosphorylase